MVEFNYLLRNLKHRPPKIMLKFAFHIIIVNNSESCITKINTLRSYYFRIRVYKILLTCRVISNILHFFVSQNFYDNFYLLKPM